jgi:large subunit ribosomal protein L23
MILNPISTEKALRLMQTENKLLFRIEKSANKQDVKKEIEEKFKVKVAKVTTYITTKGDKRAYVKLTKQYPATDVATNLGMI